MPFLEVLTRCYKRPTMLKRNQESLARQTDSDWIQTLLIDNEGLGIGWSYQNMAAYAPHLVGEYIWILDDDDECTRDTLVADLKVIGSQQPEIIFTKMNHGTMGVLPNTWWGCEPIQGDIGVSAYVVRRDVWQRFAGCFGSHYAGDYQFISAVFAETKKHVWLDVVASKVQRISYGKPE